MTQERASYIGVPEMFELNAACQLIDRAFGYGHTYLVGSSLTQRDYRDVDVRLIIDDEEFERLFGKISERFDLNARWALMSISISHWLRLRTGLPVDFQIQPRTYANEKFDGQRSALGMFLEPR
jgi:hypothetical protein